MKTVTAYQTLAGRALSRAYGKPGATTNLAVSTSTATTSALVQGIHYLVQSSCDCFFKVAGTAATTDMPVYAKTPYLMVFGAETDAAAPAVAAITATGTGTLSFTRMDEVDSP